MPETLICQNPSCQKEFQVYKYRIDTAKFCSRLCKGAYQTRLDRAERFWSRVEKTGACWLWKGGSAKRGYGVTWVGTNTRKTSSRVAYELTYGPIPDDIFVCHHCDNPPCVRPDHLFLGNAQDNSIDCHKKGRHNPPKGEKHYRAILGEDDVRHILSQNGLVAASTISRKYRIHRNTVYSIWNRKSWRSLIINDIL